MTLRMLVAVTLALGGFALALAACGTEDDADAPPATTTTTEHSGHTTTTAETEPTPTKPAVRTISIVVVQGRPRGGIKTYSVKKGERAAIVVRTDAGESVHLHGYWLEQPVVAGKPTRILFTATTPGRFDVELHHPDAVLAAIQVEP